MPEILLFTNNDLWLEAIDERRADSPEDLLSALEDLLDNGEIDEHLLIHFINRENKMAKNDRATTLSLALSKASNKDKAQLRTPRVKPKAPAPKERPLLTNTGILYLGAAIDKLCDPLHPNFVAKIKPDTKAVYDQIRYAACLAYDAHSGKPKQIVLALIRALKPHDRAFIQTVKDLNANAAFNAHMDCVHLTRKINPEQLEAGLDAMGESHDIEGDDIPPFDVGGSDSAAPREDYAGGDATDPQPIATSVADAYAAIAGVQAWLSLAVSGMTPEQRQYWGVDGLMPFGQRVDIYGDEKVYTPLNDFDAYREWQKESYARKMRSVPLSKEVEDLMNAG